MKNIWKSISDFLFGKKDALSAPCQKTYEQLEKDHTDRVIKACKEIKEEKLKINNPYIIEFDPITLSPEVLKSMEPSLMGTSKTIVPKSTKEENDKFYGYPMDEKVTSGYLRTESDIAPEPGILTTSSTDDIMVVDINQNPPKISFFTPEDNEITLDEKKSDEIKKKRQYKKKKKK